MLVLSFLIMMLPNDTYQAVDASSYTNAKEFYHSTGDKHIDVEGGDVYFATQAKMAASSSNTRYTTLGFDVTLTGGGRNVTFSVKRGGTLKEVPYSSVQDNGYEYLLYRIAVDDLIRLAQATGNSNTSTVLNASIIDVCMDAIMTTKKNGVEKGWISENGYGGLNESSDGVYHLKNTSHLDKMMEIFSGHNFKSYKNIEDELKNHLLAIVYDAGEGATVGNGFYKKAFVQPDITVYNAIYNYAGVVHDDYRVANEFYLKSPSYFGLSKTGYYLPSGKEWVKADGSVYTHSRKYNSKQVEPMVGYQDKRIALRANWQPHKYNIIYNANGGTGSMPSTSLYYDSTKQLNNNTFTRTGYKFIGWNTRADGRGTSYTNQQNVKNLMSTSGSITLYAQWEPCVYKVTMDKQTGTGGTDAFWQKYATGFYSNAAATNKIGSITIPDKRGYDFTGYFSWILGGGNKVVNDTGSVVVGNTYFTYDTTVYANWKPKTFILTFDHQGGTQGSIFATATYDSVYPMEKVTAPVKEGYRFMGYFTETNGAGEMIYNEFMSADKIYQEITDQTLYAHWIDDVPPEVTLSSKDVWTNQEITLEATCSDLGSGLKSVAIYLVDEDGKETLVAEESNLDGIKLKEISFLNQTEGVIRYKAVATDMEGNTKESYNTALYDITAPTGEVIMVQKNGDTFYIEVDVTDINTGD